MSVVFYEGERIYFRPVEPEDEPLLRKWINDPRVWSTLHSRPPLNSVRENEWIQNFNKDDKDIVFGVAVKEDDRLIGSTGLHGIRLHSRKATFGIMIGDVDSQNSGFGTEAVALTLRYAFEELNLNRVMLHVFDHNPRAQHVYEKNGFVLEGRLRQDSYRHGQYRDVLVYGLLRAEWQALQEQQAEARLRVEAVV